MQETCRDYYLEFEASISDEKGCCLLCGESYPDCLCYDCKCTNCYWYEPSSEYFGESGERRGCCEHIRPGEGTSKIKIKNATESTSKAVHAEIDGWIGWIPLSVINKEGYVKQWFIDKILANKKR